MFEQLWRASKYRKIEHRREFSRCVLFPVTETKE